MKKKKELEQTRTQKDQSYGLELARSVLEHQNTNEDETIINQRDQTNNKIGEESGKQSNEGVEKQRNQRNGRNGEERTGTKEKNRMGGRLKSIRNVIEDGLEDLKHMVYDNTFP